MLVNGTHVEWFPHTAGYNPQDLCVFGALSRNGTDQITILDIPSNCSVVWKTFFFISTHKHKGKGPLRATPSMTLGEIAATYATCGERDVCSC